MTKEIGQFRTSFIGYDKTQVDSYINKIKSECEEKLNIIKDSIRDTLEENEKINREYQKLIDKKADQNKSEELRDFMLLKLDNIVKLIDENSKDEIKSLKEENKRKEAEIDSEIEKLNKHIKNTQENVDVLLKTVIRKNENHPIIEEKVTGDKSVFKVIQYKEKSKRMLQNDNDNKEEESKIAVNGGNMDMSEDKIENVAKAETKKEEIEKISEKDIIQERTTSFWGDEIEEENIVIEKKEDVTSEPANTVKVENPVKTENPVKADTTAEAENTVKPDNPVKSEAVLNSIDNMRSRYIVGKLAGEDLVSKNGELIVSKGSVITEDIVQKSERAGKIAELIINMTIPDIVQ